MLFLTGILHQYSGSLSLFHKPLEYQQCVHLRIRFDTIALSIHLDA